MSGKERTLRFSKGRIGAISSWSEIKPGTERPVREGFVCSTCGEVSVPEGASQAFYYQLLHSDPELAEGPNRSIDRRRGDRVEDPTWILARDSEGGVDDPDRAHFTLDGMIEAGPKLALDPRMFMKTQTGYSVFVPVTFHAHCWFESKSERVYPKPGELKLGRDFSVVSAETARNVTEKACKHQLAFLKGTGSPLAFTMEQLGAIAGVDSSTVSRCGFSVRLKYGDGKVIYLKRLLPLVFAPTGSGASVETIPGGEVRTVEQIKEIITEIVTTTSPRPSDRKIGELLSARGIGIARRTVSKYRADIERRARAELSIPIDFPEPFRRFRDNRALSAAIRGAGVTNFEVLRHLDRTAWDKLYEPAGPELRHALVSLYLAIQAKGQTAPLKAA